MTAHKHAEMIKAKADNMDLVRFVKLDDNQGKEWVIQSSGVQSSTQFNDSREYFLCLQQHKEACLHWLNGGEIQDYYDNEWSSVGEFNGGEWSIHTLMMDENASYRIKPRTEKRYIAIRKSDLFIEDCLFFSVENAIKQGYPESQWQLHEIEVEV